MRWTLFFSIAWMIFYFAPTRRWRITGLGGLLLFLFLGLGSGG